MTIPTKKNLQKDKKVLHLGVLNIKKTENYESNW